MRVASASHAALWALLLGGKHWGHVGVQAFTLLWAQGRPRAPGIKGTAFAGGTARQRRTSAGITPCPRVVTDSVTVMLVLIFQFVSSPVQCRAGPRWQEVPQSHAVCHQLCGSCSRRVYPWHRLWCYLALNTGLENSVKTSDKPGKASSTPSRNFIDNNKVFQCLLQEGGTRQAQYWLTLPEITV